MCGGRGPVCTPSSSGNSPGNAGWTYHAKCERRYSSARCGCCRLSSFRAAPVVNLRTSSSEWEFLKKV